MSIKLMSEILGQPVSRSTGSKLVIMLCLADHANDNGETLAVDRPVGRTGAYRPRQRHAAHQRA